MVHIVRIHMTLQAGSSALPPLEVVVMAAVFAISSITALQSCVKIMLAWFEAH
jgi:hypothetical protein